MPSMQGTPGSIPTRHKLSMVAHSCTPVPGRYKVISGYPVSSMPAWDLGDSSPEEEKTWTVTHCTHGDIPVAGRDREQRKAQCVSSAILTCQPRSRKLTYSSCFLQACLWSLLLFSAWTKRKIQGGERSTYVFKSL